MPGKNSIPQFAELEHLFMSNGEDFMRKALQKMLNLIMELEVEAATGAAKYERNSERKTYRNGTRTRELATGVGQIELRIPKLRKGESYYPAFLEPRRMVDKAFVSVIQEAYINGVSTRKVDRLVEDMGIKIDKSAVSRLCKNLDEDVNAFKNRPIIGEFPYVWLDATFPKVREGGHVIGMAFMVATAVNMNGEVTFWGLMSE